MQEQVVGDIYKDDALVLEKVKFNLSVVEYDGFRSATVKFILPSRCKLPENPMSPMFKVKLQDGRGFEFAVENRIADSVQQYFTCKALRLK